MPRPVRFLVGASSIINNGPCWPEAVSVLDLFSTQGGNMARAMREVTVCDFDDQIATDTVNFKGPDGKTYQLDVCAGTLREFMRKAHAPRRARPAGSTNSKNPAIRKKPTNGRRTRKRTGTKKAAARKRRTTKKTSA
jgi:hypothetical protein